MSPDRSSPRSGKILAQRVNATLEVIEKYYDEANERDQLERRRRPFIGNRV